jgi:HSP20 family protein
MTLIRWEPVRELHTLQQEMNRLFSGFTDPSTAPVDRQQRWVPAMDVVETDEHYILRADLPGLSEDDVKVDFEENVLTVSGERKSEHEVSREGYYRVERSVGSFSRSLTLPGGIDPEGIGATFDKGVLEVRIPKPQEAKPRRVEIAIAQRPGQIEGEARSTAEEATGGKDATPQDMAGAVS